MPAAYSHDLREKVVAALDRGERKSQVSQMFNISRDTIDRWLKRREITGSVKAAQGYQQGHSHRVKDWQAFRAFAQTYGDRTQAEMAQLWHGPISQRTIARALAQIDWTRKKRRTVTANGMKPSVTVFERN
jgi:transposase